MSKIFDRLKQLSAKDLPNKEATASVRPIKESLAKDSKSPSKVVVAILGLSIVVALGYLIYSLWMKSSASPVTPALSHLANSEIDKREPSSIAADSGKLNREAIQAAQSGNLEKAKSLILEALEQEPTKPLYLFNQALIFEASGNTEQAVVSLQTMLSSAPAETPSPLLKLAKDRLWYLEKTLALQASEASK